MSETYEDCLQLFCIRCADVGLDCNCNIYGISEETTIINTIVHMFENHAITLEEMTACMKLKIKDDIQVLYSPSLESLSSFNNQSWQY